MRMRLIVGILADTLFVPLGHTQTFLHLGAACGAAGVEVACVCASSAERTLDSLVRLAQERAGDVLLLIHPDVDLTVTAHETVGTALLQMVQTARAEAVVITASSATSREPNNVGSMFSAYQRTFDCDRVAHGAVAINLRWLAKNWVDGPWFTEPFEADRVDAEFSVALRTRGGRILRDRGVLLTPAANRCHGQG